MHQICWLAMFALCFLIVHAKLLCLLQAIIPAIKLLLVRSAACVRASV